ncbi:hypothetical protein [Actinomycetospora soli]|uniref:hypothetical protein n=1 Tax=Actinomycetospora soli TaxID=2893887 RepID=UPI001E29FAD3|nr:hypothetical protein [Actinomycetospora soli]MCD2190572.1 hypothetical protein [Actinomycetospora soli]
MAAGNKDDAGTLRTAARLLEELRARTPGGEWEVGGLLATRPEIVARHSDGSSEHVAETRARSSAWIAGLAPSLAAPLVTWLRTTADAVEAGRASAEVTGAATAFAAAVTDRLDGRA